MADAPLKCVIVGDEEAGKIKLLQSMCRMVDPGRPSQRAIYEGHTITAMVDNRKYVISLWDTSGQEEYETIRQLSYRDADIYLVCFSLVQPNTFHNVQEMWLQEVQAHSHGAPILLVGTKLDKRNKKREQGQTVITHDEGMTLLAQSDSRCCYVECSYKTRQGMQTLVEKMVREGRHWKKINQWHLSRTCRFL